MATKLILITVLIFATAFSVAAQCPCYHNGDRVKVRYRHHWRPATVIGDWSQADYYIWVSIDRTQWVPLIANFRSDVRAR